MAFGSQNSAALNVASQAGIITKGKDIFDSSHNCGREIRFELMGDHWCFGIHGTCFLVTLLYLVSV